MAHTSKTQYLDTKVGTASQPQLHLMLLDGALRFGRQAKEAWGDGEISGSADSPLVRMIDIVEELATGAATGKDKASKSLEEQYAFVYRELTASRINHQLDKLDRCLQFLEYQRETWKLACEKLSEQVAVKLPTAHFALPTTGSLSLEA